MVIHKIILGPLNYVLSDDFENIIFGIIAITIFSLLIFIFNKICATWIRLVLELILLLIWLFIGATSIGPV